MIEHSIPPLTFIAHDSTPRRKKPAGGQDLVKSHISARYRRWRKSGKESLVLHPTTQNVLQHPRLYSKKHDDAKPSPSTKIVAVKPSPPHKANDSKRPPTPIYLVRNHAELHISPSPKGGLREDPFYSLPIPSEGCVPVIVDYFIHQWAPEYDADYALAGYGHPHTAIVFPLAMEQPVLLESLVAMCRVFWLIARKQSWETDTEYIKHRGRALALVQARLASDQFADNATLLAIVCLTSLELLASNIQAVIAHAQGLNTLVDKRKDAEDASEVSKYAKSSARAHGMLGGYLSTRRNEDHLFRGPATLRRSLSQPLTYPIHPFRPEICAALSTLPTGFSELALGGSLSTQFIYIISSLSKKIQRHSQTQLSSADQSADLRQEHDALQYLYTMDKTPTEDYLINALISFCNQYPDKTTRSPFFNIALKCFDHALEAREKILGVWGQDCLVWVAFVIAGALDICAEPLSSRHIVLDSCLAECRKARHWSSLEPILRSFFWTDALGKHWKRCWEAAMSRREGETTSCGSTPSESDKQSPSSTTSSKQSGPPVTHSASLGELLHETHSLTTAYVQAQG